MKTARTLPSGVLTTLSNRNLGKGVGGGDKRNVLAWAERKSEGNDNLCEQRGGDLWVYFKHGLLHTLVLVFWCPTTSHSRWISHFPFRLWTKPLFPKRYMEVADTLTSILRYHGNGMLINKQLTYLADARARISALWEVGKPQELGTVMNLYPLIFALPANAVGRRLIRGNTRHSSAWLDRADNASNSFAPLFSYAVRGLAAFFLEKNNNIY